MYIDLFKSQPVSEIKLKKKISYKHKTKRSLLSSSRTGFIALYYYQHAGKKIVSNMQNNANIVATVNITITD